MHPKTVPVHRGSVVITSRRCSAASSPRTPVSRRSAYTRGHGTLRSRGLTSADKRRVIGEENGLSSSRPPSMSLSPAVCAAASLAGLAASTSPRQVGASGTRRVPGDSPAGRRSASLCRVRCVGARTGHDLPGVTDSCSSKPSRFRSASDRRQSSPSRWQASTTWCSSTPLACSR